MKKVISEEYEQDGLYYLQYGDQPKVSSEGYEQDGLYYLQYGDQPKVGASALAYDGSVIQWHLRLGHASLKSIKLLFHYVKDVSKLPCE